MKHLHAPTEMGNWCRTPQRGIRDIPSDEP